MNAKMTHTIKYLFFIQILFMSACGPKNYRLGLIGTDRVVDAKKIPPPGLSIVYVSGFKGGTFRAQNSQSAVVAQRQGDLIRVLLSVRNEGASDVAFEPRSVTLMRVRGEKVTELTYIDPDEYVADAEREIRRQEAWDHFSASFRDYPEAHYEMVADTTGSYDSMGSGGLRHGNFDAQTRIKVKDNQMIERLRQQDAAIATSNANSKRVALADESSLLLRDGLLGAGKEMGGFILFEASDADRYILSIPIGNEVHQYEFKPQL